MNNIKTIAIIAFITLMGCLFALEENIFVTINNMYSPMGFNEEETVLYGTGYDFTGVCKWTEENDFEIINDTFTAFDYTNSGYISGEINAIASYINPAGEVVEIGNFENGVTTGQYISTAYTVNSDATVFAGMGWMSGMHTNAFSWTEEGGFVNLSPSDEISSRVNIMNADGSIFYGWTTSEYGSRLPIKWENGTETIYPSFNNADDGEIMGISQNGEYVCGISAGAGAVWDTDGNGTFSGETGMGWMTVYNKISNDGIAVGVERNFFEMVQNGIVWSETTGKMTASEYLAMYGISIPDGYNIDFVNYISPDGSVLAGSAFDPDFNHVSWFVKLGTLSTIEGSVTLDGTIGNMEEVMISTGSLSTSPDADGNYSISLPAGTYDLTASLPGYEPTTITDIVLAENSTVSDIDFTLTQIPNITTITGNVTLITYSGIMTEVEIMAGNYSTHPNDLGEYELLIPAGNYDLLATLNEHFSVTIPAQDYEVGQTYTQDFTLYHEMMTVPLNGQVNTDGSSPIANGKVESGQNLGYINDNGSFTQYLPFGNYDVTCYVPGYKISSQNVDITFDDFESGVDVTFDLTRNYYPAKNINLNGDVMTWNDPLAPTAISENFDKFPVNSFIGSSHPFWYPAAQANGSPIDAVIIEDPAMEGNNVLSLNNENDVVMNLMDLTTGTHYIDFDIMIPEGNAAHFDLLHSLYNITMGIEVFFRENGTMEVLYAGQQQDFEFENDQFFHISNIVNLDTNQAQFLVNGVEYLSYDWNIDSFSGQVVEWAPLGWLNISADPRPESGENADFVVDNVDFYNTDNMSTEAVYNIYLDNLETPIAQNVDSNEYTFENLVVGETYTAGIQAVYPDGQVSEIKISTFIYSSGVEIEAPINLTADSFTGIIAWEMPERALTGFNIYLDDQFVTTLDSEVLAYQFDNLQVGETYSAGVASVYDEGMSEIVEVEFTFDPVDNEVLGYVTEFSGNYPNPFNPTTTIKFSLATQSKVSIVIYNVKGQVVKTLVKDEMNAGNHSVVWNGNDDNQKSVSSGIYFAKFHGDNHQAISKMILMK
jgi:hypothetical protein